MNIPNIYDYVLCKEHDSNKYLDLFLENNIGQIIKFNFISQHYNSFVVEYTNAPTGILDYFYSENSRIYRTMIISDTMMKSDIIKFSSNKQDLEIMIDSNKYNL